MAKAKVSLSSSSSIADITAARDEVKASYDELTTAIDKIEADRKDDLAAARTQLQDAIKDIDTDLTVPEAAATLTDELAEVEAAQEALEAALTCS
ncbi:hypothetical protein G7085_06735 [Tessaracoccus sp. HDW20]|uniref:hypothetical protein n=1 Tax=Tessaracoccus coleopterorum TaxID=2714950 RepID=UPI0018D3F4FC|nr:hypothetical protein [Tessaracoccus coleopterorum]NHB84401.1 hypothetical protein [Tessaracoccus coleopterorum]